MINYDSFSRCHLTDIFFRFSRGSKRVELKKQYAINVHGGRGVDPPNPHAYATAIAE